jgi:hypothetical protein
VVAQDVATGDDPADHLGMRPDLVAHQTEDRADVPVAQHVEQAQGVRRVGTVVEGEADDVTVAAGGVDHHGGRAAGAGRRGEASGQQQHRDRQHQPAPPLRTMGHQNPRKFRKPYGRTSVT